jgi:ABC-2 type transport system permease protein
MSFAPTAPPLGGTVSWTLAHRRRVYWLEARYELLKLLRMPAFAIPSLSFPVLFYLFFGMSFSSSSLPGGVNMATYLLATYGCFGVLGVALFGFGVGLATERGQGWLELKRATPMPVLAPFVAKLAASVLFGLVIVTMLLLLGTAAGKVRLDPGLAASLVALVALGAVPYGAAGMAIGSHVGPNGAAAIVNLVYLPMALISGLWLPVQILPGFLQQLSPLLPAYHHSQLVLKLLGASRGEPVWTHLLALAVWTAIGVAAARRGLQRNEGRSHG